MRCDKQNFYDRRRSCSGTGSFQVLCLGDIDVLIIDREYHKIIAAEVKNFNFSKNPYEMHLEYKKMFENTKKKKGYYTKHCRRVDWCNKHIDRTVKISKYSKRITAL